MTRRPAYAKSPTSIFSFSSALSNLLCFTFTFSSFIYFNGPKKKRSVGAKYHDTDYRGKMLVSCRVIEADEDDITQELISRAGPAPSLSQPPQLMWFTLSLDLFSATELPDSPYRAHCEVHWGGQKEFSAAVRDLPTGCLLIDSCPLPRVSPIALLTLTTSPLHRCRWTTAARRGTRASPP